jgi:drug/metabolite transporter (DMT)-like permease
MLTIRFVVATLGIWGMVFLLHPPMRQPPATLGKLGFLGLLFVTNSLTYYMSLQELSADTACLLVFSFPALVVIWSAFFFKERLNKVRSLALVLALAGCALTVDPMAALAPGHNFSWLGVSLALGSALSNSFYVLLSGRFGRGVPGLVVAAWGAPVTASIFSIWAFSSGQFQFQLPLLAWICCIAIGLGTALGICFFLKGIQLIGPSQASITSTTEPATTVLISILLMGEPASPVKLAGGVIIISAVVLLSRR